MNESKRPDPFDFSLAAEIHRTLLPKSIRHDRIWVDVRYIPVNDVGGDYCQVRFPDRNTCYITKPPELYLPPFGRPCVLFVLSVLFDL